MAGKVLETVVSLAGEISPSLGKAIESATGRLGKLNLKAAAIGGAVGGIAVATGKAVVEAGKYLKDLGSAFDGATDAIRIGTGATGEALDGLLDDFDAVYKSVPTSMEAASQAIADYNTRLGVSGPILQDLSKKALQTSDMLGDDLGGVIQESSEAFQAWNIDTNDMGAAMDYVFKVSQSTGKGFSDIMATVQKFAPEMQDLGYSFEGAAAFMGQLDKAGVNTDEVLTALKKSVTNLTKDGLNAADGLQQYIGEIKNASSASEAAAKATEIFGTKAGVKMSELIRSGALSVSDLVNELNNSTETINGAAEDTYDFAERLQLMKQSLEVALKPMANTVFDGLNQFMPVLQKLLEKIVPTIQKAVEAAAPFVEDFLLGAADALALVLPLVANLTSSLLPILSQLLSEFLPPLLSLTQNLIPPVMEILNAILPPTIALLGSILPLISQIASAVLPVLVNTINLLLPILQPIFDLALSLLTSVVMPLIEPLMLLVQSLMPLLAPLLGAISAILEPLSPVLKVIGDVLGVIIGAISKVVGWVSTGLGWIVKLIFGGGGDTEAAEKVNAYAAGGFTNGFSIAGEDPRYPTEAVISFNPKYRDENIGYWQKAGRMLGISDAPLTYSAIRGREISEMQAISGEPLNDAYNGSSTVTYDMSGLQFSPNITIAGDGNADDIVEQLRKLEPEFVDFVLDAIRKREAGVYVTADSRLY